MGSWSLKPDGTFDYWSPETFVLFGFHRSEGIPTLPKWLTVLLRSNMQKFQAVPKTVTKVRGNGDARSRFDGRNNAIKTVVLLHHPRFLFHLRKDRRKKKRGVSLRISAE
jgi:hypothetical protein